MNGNFKYALTEEQRNKLKRKLSGKNVKGLASRADVCALLQKELDRLIGNGVIEGVAIPVEIPFDSAKPIVEVRCASCDASCSPAELNNDRCCETCSSKGFTGQLNFTAEDFTPDEVAEVIKQNKLLLTRINILQHRLDLSMT